MSTSSQVLLSGNEAVAQGAYEAGVLVGVGYPGTPSTETLESLARHEDVYTEWAPNEKVALEVAIGVSLGGARSLTTMKHVGVNVAADPLFTAAYTGVNGGMAILIADDPGTHSSQNEQDSRNYAHAARLPMLEPADSSEARMFTKEAFALSERFDIPFLIRSTVRIAHTKTLVDIDARVAVPTRGYVKDPMKWVMMPAAARKRRRDGDERLKQLIAFAEATELNRTELRDTSMGIICSGACYQHVREALPEASVFKLGMSYPLPPQRLKEFASQVDAVYVVEEAFDYFATHVRALGIGLSTPVVPLPVDGELSPGIIRSSFGIDTPACAEYRGNLPSRPPALCPGCPHRLVFNELSRLKAIVTGDIGCYTLGAQPPLSTVDSCVDMGASVSMSHGMELVKQFALDASDALINHPVVAIIGDSTFAHSGITSLLGTIYNDGAGTICILDNRTTAMTGQQGNPVNGITLQNRPSRELDLMKLLEALGVEDARLVDAQDLGAVRAALKEAVNSETLSVIVFRSPCVLLERTRKPVYHVREDCRACGTCIKLGCPALGSDDVGQASIDAGMCIGCAQCAQVCPFGCIEIPCTATAELEVEGTR